MRFVLLSGNAHPFVEGKLERSIAWLVDSLVAELTAGLDEGLAALIDGAGR